MEMEDNHEREGVSAAGEGEGLSVETPYGGEAESAADSVDQVPIFNPITQISSQLSRI